MNKNKVGLLGATSPVGAQVVEQLTKQGVSVVAFSRNPPVTTQENVQWVNLSTCESAALSAEIGTVEQWITVSPIWILQPYFKLLQQLGATKLVCLSSTSQFTKTESSSAAEEETVRKLVEGEQQLQHWASTNNISWVVLRPTLIYGRGNDRNLSEIVKIIKKLRFFPLFGKALGLRQPIYVDDVAKASILAIQSSIACNKAYNISGAEQLSYREMVSRVFVALGLKPRLLSINIGLFNLALVFLRLIPRYRNWNADMVQRMNRDMIFDHQQAKEDFNFNPQPFNLTDIDVGN